LKSTVVLKGRQFTDRHSRLEKVSLI